MRVHTLSNKTEKKILRKSIAHLLGSHPESSPSLSTGEGKKLAPLEARLTERSRSAPAAGLVTGDVVAAAQTSARRRGQTSTPLSYEPTEPGAGWVGPGVERKSSQDMSGEDSTLPVIS
jgi:hypothetical protein